MSLENNTFDEMLWSHWNILEVKVETSKLSAVVFLTSLQFENFLMRIYIWRLTVFGRE